MKFNDTYNKYLTEASNWEESHIEVKSKPLKRLLVDNKEYTAKHGFVLFNENDDYLDVMLSKLPKSILTREGAKEFSLKLINDLKPAKAIRGKLISMITDLRFYLEGSLDDKIEEAKFTPNTTDVTSLKCSKCGYRHSDEVTEIPKGGVGAPWQKSGEVYCSRCGNEIEHVNIADEKKKLKDK